MTNDQRLFDPPGIVAITGLAVIGVGYGFVTGGGWLIPVAGVVSLLWGAAIAGVCTRLNRVERSRRAWGNRSIAATIVVAGFLTGAALMSQLFMNAALSDQPLVFAELVRGSIGDAGALPFFMFNPPLELLLIPAALVLNWRSPRRRTLLLIAFVLFTASRLSTYIYFAPRIGTWGETATGTALPPDVLDQARLWIQLSWIRFATDVAIFILAAAAAFAPGAPDARPRTRDATALDPLATPA